MSISIDAALGPHADALALRAKRMGVLANNIAHADTPGYQARDIDFKAVLASRQGEASNSVWRTHPGHRQGPGMHSMTGAEPLKYRMPLMPSADSNTVDVQVEQAQMAQNNIQFQAAYRFLNGKISSLNTAIRGE
ncbi:MAG: flagellar basal body rod protein FlgB [Pseudomonadales bacterium]